MKNNYRRYLTDEEKAALEIIYYLKQRMRSWHYRI